MPQIVLAVAEGALAVFPRFAPQDRGERDEKPVASAGERIPCGSIDPRAAGEIPSTKGTLGG